MNETFFISLFLFLIAMLYIFLGVVIFCAL